MTHEILIDARWQEPPEPMARVLAALDLIPSHEHIRLLIQREPVPLYAILHERGYGYHVTLLDDGCFELLIEQLREPG